MWVGLYLDIVLRWFARYSRESARIKKGMDGAKSGRGSSHVCNILSGSYHQLHPRTDKAVHLFWKGVSHRLCAAKPIVLRLRAPKVVGIVHSRMPDTEYQLKRSAWFAA